MTATYIDPVSKLPRRFGEIYSDRNIRVTGLARFNQSTGVLETSGLKILCPPIGGGQEGISVIPDGSYTLPWDAGTGRGSSMWGLVTRGSGVTTTLALGTNLFIDTPTGQRLPQENYMQLFYRASIDDVVSVSTAIVSSYPFYKKLGFSSGQQVFDAIVGDTGDYSHIDLQQAINDTPAGGWILVKKMVSVGTTINTNGKTVNLMFKGSTSGLSAAGATTGLILQGPNCQVVGYGTISGFSVAGVNLNSQTGSRIEMVFSGNGGPTNPNALSFGSLNGTQYNIEGSYGLTWNSQIETGVSDGQAARWNNTSKRWEPVSGVTLGTGTLVCTTSISAAAIYGAVYS